MQIPPPTGTITKAFFRNEPTATPENPPAKTNSNTTVTPATNSKTNTAPNNGPEAESHEHEQSSVSDAVFTSLQCSSSTSNRKRRKAVKAKKSKNKLTRRGGRKRQSQLYISDKFSIYHTNIQSVHSRKVSLQSIVNTFNSDLVTINETNLKKNAKLHMDGYKCFSRNRKNAAMGGVTTAVKEKHFQNTLKVNEGEKEEYIITRHSQFQPAINVINHYGTQESRQSSDEIKEGWEVIVKEIVNIEAM